MVENKKKIAVLVSGGVDSSVSLALLKNQGHDVEAFYLKIWLEDELSFLGDCPWQDDLSYVEAVCKKLKVPLHVLSLQKEYWDQVVSYTIAEVAAGRTPNPDIFCNVRIKFGAFYDRIDASYEKVATGHYAQIEEQGGLFLLKQAPDPVKDQTYFLAHLNQQQLSRALFPVGHLSKAQVRALAHEFDLLNKDRKDSQGICFLGKLKFSEFLKFHLGQKIGNLVEIETGAVLGTHTGFWFYTIGQRQGLGLAGGPWYVVDKDPLANRVYISRNYYDEDKKRNSFTVVNCNWIAGISPEQSHLLVKIRHGQQFHQATLSYANDNMTVLLAERDQGIASGQFAVFYDKGYCLGTGMIQYNRT